LAQGKTKSTTKIKSRPETVLQLIKKGNIFSKIERSPSRHHSEYHSTEEDQHIITRASIKVKNRSPQRIVPIIAPNFDIEIDFNYRRRKGRKGLR
jgi:hypothetical protein